jgi:hypothetical protein
MKESISGSSLLLVKKNVNEMEGEGSLDYDSQNDFNSSVVAS